MWHGIIRTNRSWIKCGWPRYDWSIMKRRGEVGCLREVALPHPESESRNRWLCLQKGKVPQGGRPETCSWARFRRAPMGYGPVLLQEAITTVRTPALIICFCVKYTSTRTTSRPHGFESSVKEHRIWQPGLKNPTIRRCNKNRNWRESEPSGGRGSRFPTP